MKKQQRVARKGDNAPSRAQVEHPSAAINRLIAEYREAFPLAEFQESWEAVRKAHPELFKSVPAEASAHGGVVCYGPDDHDLYKDRDGFYLVPQTPQSDAPELQERLTPEQALSWFFESGIVPAEFLEEFRFAARTRPAPLVQPDPNELITPLAAAKLAEILEGIDALPFESASPELEGVRDLLAANPVYAVEVEAISLVLKGQAMLERSPARTVYDQEFRRLPGEPCAPTGKEEAK